MALFISSLNSGSNGNCYYVGNHNEAVLIDVGISCRETEKRMKQVGLSMSKVKAIFISHEHGDHIKGVSVLANKYSLPIYITDTTAKYGPHLIKHLSRPFQAHVPVTIGELSVTAFPKQHDAIDPHSFIVEHQDIKVGIFTDIGTVCDQLIHYFKQCHAAFLEANYDEDLLENGHYPIHLKNRIRGDQGHLSNRQAFDLFKTHQHPQLSHLLLAHLSKENNAPERALDLFRTHSGKIRIGIASRNEPTQVFTIQP